MTPWRDDERDDGGGRRRRCGVCGDWFPVVGRARYCRAACRQAAYRRRHPNPAPVPVPAAPVSRDMTIYECGTCDARYVGVQRCQDCNTFCRRVGAGGPCPHCDEPVAVSDLLGGSS